MHPLAVHTLTFGHITAPYHVVSSFPCFFLPLILPPLFPIINKRSSYFKNTNTSRLFNEFIWMWKWWFVTFFCWFLWTKFIRLIVHNDDVIPSWPHPICILMRLLALVSLLHFLFQFYPTPIKWGGSPLIDNSVTNS